MSWEVAKLHHLKSLKTVNISQIYVGVNIYQMFVRETFLKQWTLLLFPIFGRSDQQTMSANKNLIFRQNIPKGKTSQALFTFITWYLSSLDNFSTSTSTSTLSRYFHQNAKKVLKSAYFRHYTFCDKSAYGSDSAGRGKCLFYSYF